MPKGKTHDKIILLLIPYVITTIYYFSLRLKLENVFSLILIGTLSFVFGGLYLSPDLDTNSSIIKRWKFLGFIWIPYKKVIKHRSVLSHGIFIGTLIRMLYVFVIINIVVLLFFKMSFNTYQKHLISFYNYYKIYINEIFIMIELSALAHIFPDTFLSLLKSHRLIVEVIGYAIFFLIFLKLLKLY